MVAPQSRSKSELRTSKSRTLRKRVSKACDRCRWKKVKCDGLLSCSRCQADDTACVFGQSKMRRNRQLPKGYVEFLEQCQALMVQGLYELYHRSTAAHTWSSQSLRDGVGGKPLIHDLLTSLGVLPEEEHSPDIPTALPQRSPSSSSELQYPESSDGLHKAHESVVDVPLFPIGVMPHDPPTAPSSPQNSALAFTISESEAHPTPQFDFSPPICDDDDVLGASDPPQWPLMEHNLWDTPDWIIATNDSSAWVAGNE